MVCQLRIDGRPKLCHYFSDVLVANSVGPLPSGSGSVSGPDGDLRPLGLLAALNSLTVLMDRESNWEAHPT